MVRILQNIRWPLNMVPFLSLNIGTNSIRQGRVFKTHFTSTSWERGLLGSQFSRGEQDFRAQSLANSVHATGVFILATMQAIPLNYSWKELFDIRIWSCCSPV